MKFELSYFIQRSNKSDIRFNIKDSYSLDVGILGIFGQSGTGKTSLLKALAGLLPNASYAINLDDHNYQNVAAAHNPCVYVGADAVLFEHIKVLDNLKLVIKHSKFAVNSVMELEQVVSICAIEHLLQQPIIELSSGEKQRVVFARALLSGKRVILLDEALSALDWSARLYFIDLVKKLKNQYDIYFIMVSHSLKELALCCNDIWVLQEGTFILQAAANIAVDKISSSNVSEVENLFSVLDLSFIKKDELDEELEIWELSAHNDAPAQQIIKRCTSYQSVPLGKQAKVQGICSILIEAEKISLSYEKQTHSSMLNCIDVTVIGIDEAAKQNPNFASGTVISLNANGQILRSLISKRSFTNMQISVGDKLFAIFKAL